MNVVLIAAITADGLIGRDAAQSSIDWTSGADKQFFAQTTKALGIMIMGSKTFSTIGRALPERETIVMTSHPESFGTVDGVEFTSEPPAAIIERLQSLGHSGVAICGGASVYHQFMAAGLVDELYLTIEPLVFGQGVPLFSDSLDCKLQLVSSERLGEHSVLNRYKVL